MTPRERYQSLLERPGFQSDPLQRMAVEQLERIYQALYVKPIGERRWWPWPAAGTESAAQAGEQGLYLWGGVGRGKTLVMDLFYECLSRHHSRRLHFHSFMRAIHAELKSRPQTSDPLRAVAKHWAADLKVLCLDEFHVTDITDAMLLARLLEALFERGVMLVTTSNEAPDELYRGGLQRERFLPAIDLLKRRLPVLELTGALDYRLRTLEQAAVYYVPDDEVAHAALNRQFEALTGTVAAPLPRYELEDRPLMVRACADGVLWCDFAELCEGPRGTADYIEIGRCFHTVILSGVPRMTDDNNDAARRFINLLDELYDRHVNLLVSAEALPAQLYSGSRLVGPFQRAVSRLAEMQSREYLSSPHNSI